MTQKRFFLLIVSWILFIHLSISQSNYINDVCSQALPVENEQHVSLLFGISGLDTYNCGDQPVQQNGIWYTYQGKNRIVDIVSGAEQSDNIMIRVFSGSCNALNCVNTSEGRFFGDTLTTYYILIAKDLYTYGQDAVAFTIREKDAQPYDFCQQAPVLDCDNILQIVPEFLTPDVILSSCNDFLSLGWCQIAGDGQTKTISMSAGFFNEIHYSVFENDCDSLVCVYQGDDEKFSIATLPGKNYYIGIAHENQNLSIPVEIVMTCTEDDLNHSCIKAIPLDCSETLTATLSDTLAPDFVIGETGTYPGMWYVIEGQNAQHQITLNSPVIENLVIGIFKSIGGDCTTGLEPVIFNPFPLPANTYVVNTLPGEDIYIKVAYFNQPVSFSLKQECKSLENNLSCNTAKMLECEDTFQIYETSRGDFGKPKNGDEGNWFLLEGRSTPYFFETQSGNASVIFDVYNEVCDSLKLLKFAEYFLYPESGIFMDLPEGQNYIIRAHFSNFQFSALTMKVSCNENPVNVFCHTAEEIVCGEEKIINNRFAALSIGEDACNTADGFWYKFDGDYSMAELVMNFPFQQFAVYEGHCDTLRCIYANEPFDGFKNFRFQTYEGFQYYIKLFGISSTGQRSFRLLCDEAAENTQCHSSYDLICNDELTLNFQQAASALDTDCSFENGYWYTIEGSNNLVVIEGSEEVEIQLYQNDCDSLDCKATTKGYHTFFAKAGEIYFVRFASDFSNIYTFNIYCYPNAKNDCENTFNFTCPRGIDFPFGFYETQNEGDFGIPGWFGFWGAFTGDGSTYAIKNFFFGSHQISIEIYDENCEQYLSSHSLSFDETYNFPTDVGVQYKVFCSSPEPSVDGSIEINCVEKEEGLSCEEALPAVCGQQIIYQSANRSHDYVYDIYSQIWYKFTGDGSAVNLHLLQPAGLSSYAINIYETSESCDSLVLIAQHSGNDHPLFWNTVAGRDYFIQIGLSDISLSAENWIFELNCYPFEMSESCETAIPLICDSLYAASSSEAGSNAFGTCGITSPGSWYTLAGNDKVVSLEIINFYNQFEDVVVFLGEGTCDQIFCADAFVLNREQNVAEFAAFEGKTYFLKLEGDRGTAFDLIDFVITCSNQAENGGCAGALPVVCGEQITGRTKNLSIEGLQACDDELPGLFYVLETFEGEYSLQFDISGSEEFLVTVYENTCDTGGVCLYKEVVNAQKKAVRWESLTNTNQYVRITGLNPHSDIFNAIFSCEPRPENLTCIEHLLLSCEDTIQVSLQTPIGFAGQSPCHFTENARMFWYQLPATEKVMSLEILEGKNQAHYVSLVSGTCDNILCQNVYDINNENILIQKEGELPYYLVIHGDATSSNDFTFVIRCLERIENDECFDAKILNCGDTTKADVLFANYTPYAQDGCQINPWKDVWYEIEGSGDIFELEFTNETNFGGFVNIFLKGECNALSCVTNGSWRNNTDEKVFRFFGEDGVIYLISIQHPVGANTEFSINCIPRVANDLCSGAFPVLFPDTLSIVLTGSTGDDITGCSEGQREGVWYTFEGDGGLVFFSNKDTLSSEVRYVLLEGNCDEWNCLQSGVLTGEDSLTVRTESGLQYLLNFYGNDGKIAASKAPLANNASCETAKELLCNIPEVFGSNDFIPDQGESLCVNPDENTAWFVFTGTGEVRNFSFSLSGIDGSMEILTECGGQCLLRHEISGQNPDTFRLLAVEGQRYFVKLNISRSESEHLMRMKADCEEGIENYSIETALEVECGEIKVETESNLVNLLQNCYDNAFTTHWYTFTGNDSIFSITDTLPLGVTAAVITQNCEEKIQFSNNQRTFLTQKDSVYFLVLRYPSDNPSASFNFGLDYKCITDQTITPVSDLPGIKAIPNPFSDKVTLEIFSKNSGESNIQLTNSKGENLWSVRHQLGAGKQWLQLNEWHRFPSGVYLLTMTTAKGTSSVRLVKL